MKNAANKVIAVIGLSFKADYMQQMFDKLVFPAGAGFTLFDRQGFIVSRNLKDHSLEEYSGHHKTRKELFTLMTGEPDEGTFEAVGDEGTFQLFAYKRVSLPHESEPYMYIRSNIPLASAALKANVAMLRNLAVIMPLFLIGLLLAWLIGKHFIVNPAMMLKRASERLAAGAEAVNVSSVVKGGELGEVARAFDHMAEAVVQEKTALRKSEERFALALQAAQEGVWDWNMETNEVFYSSRWKTMLGYADDEIEPHVSAWERLLHPEDKARVLDAVDAVLRGERDYEMEFRLRHKDGHYVDILSRGFPVRREPGGSIVRIVGTHFDLTERKRAEEALRISERHERERAEELATLLEAVPTPVIIVHNSDGTHMTGNRAADELFRQPRGTEISLSAPPEVRSGHFRAIKDERELRLDELPARRAARGENVQDFEYSLVFDDGTARHLVAYGTPLWDDKGQPRGAVHTLVDITERKVMERALQKAHDDLEQRVIERTEQLAASEKEFRTLAEAMPQIVWITRADGWNIYFNQQWVDYTGLTLEESYGHGWNKPFHPDDQQRAWDAWQNAVTNNGTYSLECRLRAADGTYRWWLVRGVPVANEKGETTKWFGTCTDIEEFKRVEAQLRQVQKMEALGTMSGGIAHDFNNILAAIIGFTELLEGHIAKGSRDARHLHRIMEAGIRGRELVRQMLTFSAERPSRRRNPYAVSSIVKETVKLHPGDHAVNDQHQGQCLKRSLDPRRSYPDTAGAHEPLHQCRSCDAGERRQSRHRALRLQRFTVEWRPPRDRARPLREAFRPRHGHWHISRHHGQDIRPLLHDEEARRRHGPRSFRGPRHREAARRLTLRSRVNPAGGPPSPYTSLRSRESLEADALHDDEIPTGSERILFVDDEEALVEMGEDILAELGYEVTSRMNGREALALLKSDPSRFDLVITDQTMPEMTGVELAKEVLAIRADMPIIMCTGFSYVVDADKAKAAGIKAFAMKPLTKREIAKTIRKVLDE